MNDRGLDRVYFDNNDGDQLGRYGLGFDASKADLARIADLRDGRRVFIYMTGELEMEATLEFDAALDAWMARPIAGTTRYNPASLPKLDLEFQIGPADTETVALLSAMAAFARTEGFSFRDSNSMFGRQSFLSIEFTSGDTRIVVSGEAGHFRAALYDHTTGAGSAALAARLATTIRNHWAAARELPPENLPLIGER